MIDGLRSTVFNLKWWNKAFGSGNYEDVRISRQHRPDTGIVLMTGLLMLLGLIIIYAIGPQRANVLNNAYGAEYSSSYFFIKQLMSVTLAVVAFFIAYKIPLKTIGKWTSKLLLLALLASAVLAVAGVLDLPIAKKALGATRWFNVAGISIQPAEFLKVAILLFGAGFLGNKIKQGKINNTKETIIPFLAILAVALFFVVVLQKDLGTGVSIMAIAGMALLISGIDLSILMKILGVMAVMGLLLVVSSPHRVERVATYIKGDSTSVDDAGSYHIEHAKIAIGSGGLWGVGIGNSVQATGYLPEAINDSVFAIMGETFGFIGLIVIMFMFGYLIWRLIELIRNLADPRLKLIAAGILGWIASHVILNISAMIGFLPLTGITLPLLSFGGTSMLFIAAVLGLAFHMSSYTEHPSRNKEAKNENSYSRRRVGRSRHASRRSY